MDGCANRCVVARRRQVLGVRLVVVRIFCALVVMSATKPSPAGPLVERDETIVFFTTFAHRAADGRSWVIPIHGCVYEAEENCRIRAAVVERFGEWLSAIKDPAMRALCNERARPFLVDHKRGRRVRVRLGNREYVLGRSGADGCFGGAIVLAAAEVERMVGPRPERGAALTYRAVLPGPDSRLFSGVVRLIDERGVGVISDIDDTIKVSQCLNRRALLENTFLRPFRAVPGMADLYERWAREGASFHYVSAGPWQLYEPLAKFIGATRFPAGSLVLQPFRFDDASLIKVFTAPESWKRKAIEPMFRGGPERQFILVGDSGQKDPEIYGAVARKFPAQVLHVFIREVEVEGAAPSRYRKAFRGVDPTRWTIFRDPGEIRLSLAANLESPCPEARP
jgi:hypothetical protein